LTPFTPTPRGDQQRLARAVISASPVSGEPLATVNEHAARPDLPLGWASRTARGLRGATREGARDCLLLR
jgi:hypothetical protein